MVGVVLLATACGGGGGKAATKSKSAPAAPSAAAGRNNAAVAGGGRFCDVIKAQFATFTEYAAAPLLDVAARKRYGLTSKQLNEKLVKTAPGDLGTDVATQTRVANGVADAFASGRSPSAAALAQLRSPGVPGRRPTHRGICQGLLRHRGYLDDRVSPSGRASTRWPPQSPAAAVTVETAAATQPITRVSPGMIVWRYPSIARTRPEAGRVPRHPATTDHPVEHARPGKAPSSRRLLTTNARMARSGR